MQVDADFYRRDDMAINELNHINIRTVKMEETKDFFVNVVGLEIGFRPISRRTGIGFTVARFQSSICRSAIRKGIPDHAQRSGKWSRSYWVICRFGRGRETLLDHGVTYRKCLAGGGRLVQVFFLDPNGVQVELAFDADAEGVTNDNFVPVDAGLGV